MFNHQKFMTEVAGRGAACAASAGRVAKSGAPFLICMAVAAIPVLAQSGDISGSTVEVMTLGRTALKCAFGLAVFAFAGLIIWGGVTMGTNRPRGLAMVAGGMVGALLAGLSFVLVSTLSGTSVSTPGIVLPFFLLGVVGQ